MIVVVVNDSHDLCDLPLLFFVCPFLTQVLPLAKKKASSGWTSGRKQRLHASMVVKDEAPSKGPSSNSFEGIGQSGRSLSMIVDNIKNPN
jgi:hypothetical protein